MPGTLLIVMASLTAGAGDAFVQAPPAPAEPGALQLELPAQPPRQNPGLLAPDGARLSLVLDGVPDGAEASDLMPEGARLSLAVDGAPGGAGVPERTPEGDRTARVRRWERALKWSTAGALVVTATLGTLAAINQPTAFGDGRCRTGSPILGTYGCDRGLSTLHGASAVLSATLYTADGVLALSLPGPQGNVGARARPWHRALTYVHLGGMVLQPVLGLVSAFPEVIGVRGKAPSDPFPRDLRTAHVFLGYITAAAFLTTLVLEL